MNILVTGANGQLGSEMQRLGAVSPNNYIFTDAAELDVTDAGAVRRAAEQTRAEAIVNCAAYTDVERAEENEAAADLLNRLAPANLAAAAAATGATLIHISTDYVFDGRAHTPYTEQVSDGAAERLRPHEARRGTGRRGVGMQLSDPAHGVALLGIRE